jgi:hypothetical protein
MLLRPAYLSHSLDRPLPTNDGGTLHTWRSVRLHDRHGEETGELALFMDAKLDVSKVAIK